MNCITAQVLVAQEHEEEWLLVIVSMLQIDRQCSQKLFLRRHSLVSVSPPLLMPVSALLLIRYRYCCNIAKYSWICVLMSYSLCPVPHHYAEVSFLQGPSFYLSFFHSHTQVKLKQTIVGFFFFPFPSQAMFSHVRPKHLIIPSCWTGM